MLSKFSPMTPQVKLSIFDQQLVRISSIGFRVPKFWAYARSLLRNWTALETWTLYWTFFKFFKKSSIYSVADIWQSDDDKPWLPSWDWTKHKSKSGSKINEQKSKKRQGRETRWRFSWWLKASTTIRQCHWKTIETPGFRKISPPIWDLSLWIFRDTGRTFMRIGANPRDF